MANFSTFLARYFPIFSDGPGGGLRPPRTPPIVSAFGDTDGEFFGRKIFRPKSFGPNFFRSKKFRPKNFFGRIFFGRKFFARFFSWGGLGGRSRSNHFKKFAKANFLKWCRGGVWGGLPPQESPLPVPCPPGGSGGLRPPGISVHYPCLASAAAVPCPRALPPIFFVRKNFRPKNFSAEKFFGRKFFWPKIFSAEKIFVRIFFVRPSSVRPSSVRPSSVRRFRFLKY